MRKFDDPREQHAYVTALMMHDRLIEGKTVTAEAYQRGYHYPEKLPSFAMPTYPAWLAGHDNRRLDEKLERER